MEIPHPVGVLQIGHIASDADSAFGRERRTHRVVGVQNIDRRRVSQRCVLMNATQERKGQYRGERRKGGVDESYASMQHRTPRSRALGEHAFRRIETVKSSCGGKGNAALPAHTQPRSSPQKAWTAAAASQPNSCAVKAT